MKIVTKNYISLIFFLVVLGVQCSTHTRYTALSFIFDGVPDPDAVKLSESSDSINQIDSSLIAAVSYKIKKPEFNFHIPYQQKKCESCHDQKSMGKLNEPQPGLCYQCHDDFSQTYAVLHGPVGGGYCTSCHSAHMAKSEKLLLRSGQQLCIHCHDSTMILKNEYHKDIEPLNCLECHNPHGGGNRYIMQTGTCFKCHDDFRTKYKFLHGPVAGEYCNACHSPHVKQTKKLLLREGPQLCLYCHESSQVFTSENHKDIKDNNCTKCHNPHGGDNRSNLN